jgi:hypothetical protein
MTEVNSPATVAGKIGNAIRCTGASEYLQETTAGPGNPMLNLPNNGITDFTLCMWFRPDSTSVPAITSRTFWAMDTAYNFGITGQSTGNYLWASGYVGGSWENTDLSGTAASEATDDAWNLGFWQVTCPISNDGTNTEFKLITIVGGTEYSFSEDHAGSVGPLGASYTLKIGYESATYRANSDLDMVALYTRHLTSDERMAIWNGGNGTTYPFE